MTADDPLLLFDRALVRRHRNRAAAALPEHDFLLRHCAALIVDRLYDVKRPFPEVLDLGCGGGAVGQALDGGKEVVQLVQADSAAAMVRRAAANGGGVVADEELLPFADHAFDLIVSNLSLHWVNDLPGALIQVMRTLRPDGLFVATLLGGETLTELNQVLVETDTRLLGGAAPRVSPFADLRSAAGLLQRAGFALPVADLDTVTVTYETLFSLLADLRGMGETAAHRQRDRRIPPRTYWAEAARLYAERFAEPDGRIPATFQILTLTGWSPHASQQQPLRPGSAHTRLAEALRTEEQSAGEAVPKP